MRGASGAGCCGVQDPVSGAPCVPEQPLPTYWCVGREAGAPRAVPKSIITLQRPKTRRGQVGVFYTGPQGNPEIPSTHQFGKAPYEMGPSGARLTSGAGAVNHTFTGNLSLLIL